jgi:hypothetical protein
VTSQSIRLVSTPRPLDQTAPTVFGWAAAPILAKKIIRPTIHRQCAAGRRNFWYFRRYLMAQVFLPASSDLRFWPPVRRLAMHITRLPPFLARRVLRILAFGERRQAAW